MGQILKIRKDFLQVFVLLVILETALRFFICLSFTSDIYAFSLAGILIVFIAFYILNIRNAIKNSYAVVLILLFYYLTHYAYVMGTYKYIHAMMFWFLILPISTRIFFTTRITIIVSALILLSLLIMIYVSGFLDVLNHYKVIVIDYYGSKSGRFIINIFYGIILLYNVFGVYYLSKIFKAEKESTDNEVIDSVSENNFFVEKSDPIASNIEDDLDITPQTGQTIKDVRLSDLFDRIRVHIEESRCYLDPDYSMTHLSDDMKIHRITLSQALNKVGEVSFKDFLNRYRINLAKELFLDSSFNESNIKQTYMSVGFKYHTTFNRVFKKIEGMTPTEFIINNRFKK